MKQNPKISEISSMMNEDFDGFFILNEPQVKTSANGSPFLSARLSDKTGEVAAKSWDYTGPIGEKDAGKLVKIRGRATEYRGAVQVNIQKIRLATESDSVQMSDIVPTAPIDVDAAMKQVDMAVASIKDDDYRKICETILHKYRSEFARWPAAKRIHHKFVSGLLMHISNMLIAVVVLADLYADVVDRDLLLAGTLLHDIGKIKELELGESGLVAKYSTEGSLLGHLVIGAAEVASVARELNVPDHKSILLQHMLLSHHGEPEYGAAVKPICAESALLAQIDMLDSRMEIFRENMEEMESGEISAPVFGLGTPIYKHN